MASEVFSARERSSNPLNAINSPKGRRSLSKEDEKLLNDSINRELQSVFAGREEAWDYIFPKATEALELLKKNPKKYYKPNEKGVLYFSKVAERLLSDMGEKIVEFPSSGASKEDWNSHRLYSVLEYLSADFKKR